MTESYSAAVEDFLHETLGPALLCVVKLANVSWIAQQHGLRAREAAAQEFGARIQELVRDGDGCFRISDNHFCLIVVNLIDHNHGLLAGIKLEALFANPLIINDVEIPLLVRAGFANFQTCASVRSAEHIYRIAESACEMSRERNQVFEISTVNDESQASTPRNLAHDFGNALAEGHVTLDYQPKYELQNGDLVGAEALVRWRSDGVVIPPSDFIPRLTRDQLWDMTKYCIRLAIREMPGFSGAVPIALNIDPVVLDHPEFLGFVEREVRLWDVAPQRLAFEITETAAIESYQQSHELLSALRTAGHHVAIDDFGTGQATLQHFRNLPADEIKIDRQFISNVVSNPDDRNITESIVELSHRSGKVVVAEGIEDGETVAYLIEIGCDIGQGFFLGMPMSRQQFTSLTAGLSGAALNAAS
jgi:EAL domain-containing protein (putative c-di-GMP-specific phosphodiesterase class I)/GGDEF domain-containing protein